MTGARLTSDGERASSEFTGTSFRQRLRRKLLKIVAGEYELEKEGEKHLSAHEELLASTDIIYYSEVGYALGTLQFLLSLTLLTFLTWKHWGWAIVGVFFLITSTTTLFFSTQIELIFLTTERIRIRKIGLTEKMLGIANERIIALDQIALIEHGKAPFHRAALVISSFQILVASTGIVLAIMLLSYPLSLFATLFLSLILASGIRLFWFGLRITRRSLSLYVVGVRQPIAIGSLKGVPFWFIEEVQITMFERIHHYHHLREQVVTTMEFPLQYSTGLKEALLEENKEIHRDVLMVLDTSPCSKREIMTSLPKYSPQEISEALRQLRREGKASYDHSLKKWVATWFRSKK